MLGFKTTSTVYHIGDFHYRGETYTYHRLPSQNNLEYEYVSSLVDKQLKKYGLIKSKRQPKYTIVMHYRISAPHHITTYVPIYGESGTMPDKDEGGSFIGGFGQALSRDFTITGSRPEAITDICAVF